MRSGKLKRRGRAGRDTRAAGGRRGAASPAARSNARSSPRCCFAWPLVADRAARRRRVAARPACERSARASGLRVGAAQGRVRDRARARRLQAARAAPRRGRVRAPRRGRSRGLRGRPPRGRARVDRRRPEALARASAHRPGGRRGRARRGEAARGASDLGPRGPGRQRARDRPLARPPGARSASLRSTRCESGCEACSCSLSTARVARPTRSRCTPRVGARSTSSGSSRAASSATSNARSSATKPRSRSSPTMFAAGGTCRRRRPPSSAVAPTSTPSPSCFAATLASSRSPARAAPARRVSPCALRTSSQTRSPTACGSSASRRSSTLRSSGRRSPRPWRSRRKRCSTSWPIVELLLLLDNFEQLLDAAPLVSELLQAAPRVSVLTTSRSPLRVDGEHELAVPPLQTADAEELFAARARAAGRELVDPRLVTEICDRVDRLPLAIELVAARTTELMPDELLASLERRLELASRGARGPAQSASAPCEPRSAGATGSSSRTSRRCWPRLGAFSGGFTREAVRAVCEDDAGAWRCSRTATSSGAATMGGTGCSRRSASTRSSTSTTTRSRA